MALFKMFLLLILGCFLSGQTLAMPDGPPLAACGLLQPNHNTTQQTTPTPSRIIGLESSYTIGETLEFTISLDSSVELKGFMIQARSSELEEEALGTFLAFADGKQRTMTCQSADDTASHMNPNPVMSVTLRWRADSIDESVLNFRFYYTIVIDVNTSWVRAPSDLVEVNHPPRNYALVKSHGSIMALAWGLFAPVGIMLALFYKVVWPNGEWFYSHIAVMIATLLLTIVGIIVIVIHAAGLWLTSTTANLPHQILGIIVCVAVGVNPFLAIVRCDPGSQWRWIYNWSHGIIGLVIGQGLAMATMLLGLNAFKDLPGVQRDNIHYAIYTMSCTVGLVIMIIATYNLYTITYRKNFPAGPDHLATTSEPPGSFPDKTLYTQSYKDDDDEIQPSRDYPVRAVVGIVVIIALVLFTLATIVLIALG